MNGRPYDVLLIQATLVELTLYATLIYREHSEIAVFLCALIVMGTGYGMGTVSSNLGWVQIGLFMPLLLLTYFIISGFGKLRCARCHYWFTGHKTRVDDITPWYVPFSILILTFQCNNSSERWTTKFEGSYL